MSYKIVNTLNIPGKSQGEEKLKSAEYEYIKGMWNTEEDLIANCAGADAIMGDLIRKPFVRKVIESFSPNCRILAGIGLGFDKVDLDAATEKGIVVTNVPDYCLDEVSGRAIALMLNLAYKIIPLNEACKAGKLADLFVGALQKDGAMLRRDLCIFSALLAVIVAQTVLCFRIARRLRNVCAQLASASDSFTAR